MTKYWEKTTEEINLRLAERYNIPVTITITNGDVFRGVIKNMGSVCFCPPYNIEINVLGLYTIGTKTNKIKNVVLHTLTDDEIWEFIQSNKGNTVNIMKVNDDYYCDVIIENIDMDSKDFTVYYYGSRDTIHLNAKDVKYISEN